MTESEIIKEVIVMLLDHIRPDGQVAYFSKSVEEVVNIINAVTE